MKLSEVKTALSQLTEIRFKLPDGTYLPPHFHVTEVGLIRKHFIDCGGTERNENTVNFQLWEANDYDHRLAPQKLLGILKLSQTILGEADALDIEVEYQQATISKFGLSFDGKDFTLTAKHTDCLAKSTCGLSDTPDISDTKEANDSAADSPKRGCC